MFHVGDAVVHPIRGAGIVTDIEELERQEGDKSYYRIKLLAKPGTKVMVPVNAAEEHGVREVISTVKLEHVWSVLTESPEKLPQHYKKRRRVIKERLRTGDILTIAETLRDLAWRRQRKGSLNYRDRLLYQKGTNLLAGEIAAAQEIDLEEAKTKIWEKIQQGLPASSS